MQLLLLEALQNTVSDWRALWCMYIVEEPSECVYLFAAGGRGQ